MFYTMKMPLKIARSISVNEPIQAHSKQEVLSKQDFLASSPPNGLYRCHHASYHGNQVPVSPLAREIDPATQELVTTVVLRKKKNKRESRSKSPSHRHSIQITTGITYRNSYVEGSPTRYHGNEINKRNSYIEVSPSHSNHSNQSPDRNQNRHGYIVDASSPVHFYMQRTSSPSMVHSNSSPSHSWDSSLHSNQSPVHSNQSSRLSNFSPAHSNYSPVHSNCSGGINSLHSPMHSNYSPARSNRFSQRNTSPAQGQHNNKAFYRHSYIEGSSLHSNSSLALSNYSPLHSNGSPIHSHSSLLSNSSPVHSNCSNGSPSRSYKHHDYAEISPLHVSKPKNNRHSYIESTSSHNQLSPRSNKNRHSYTEHSPSHGIYDNIDLSGVVLRKKPPPAEPKPEQRSSPIREIIKRFSFRYKKKKPEKSDKKRPRK